MPKMQLVYLSAIDEERFHIRTAKSPLITFNDIPIVMEFCRSQQVSLLIARCLATEMNTIQELERLGFSITDTLGYYSRNLINDPIPEDTNDNLVRPIKQGEEISVKNIATECFKEYFGHYHADKRLPRGQCDEVYSSWAYNSCLSSEFADKVFLSELQGTIVGFATMRMKNPREGEGILFGVIPAAQGKGIYRSLIINGMKYCLQQGAEKMSVSTQITNIAVQKVWARVGFEPYQYVYTFHKWFGRE